MCVSGERDWVSETMADSEKQLSRGDDTMIATDYL